ncbi:virulence factor TspB C-terminal domain-related protein, partial [Suttonella ornithocola]
KRTVDFGSASCPTPIEINTILAGNLRLSFQPWCDFAAMIKYLVLAAAYLLAIRINLGVIRG